MERVILSLIAAALLAAGCSYDTTAVKRDTFHDLASESAVLGPETFPFCGGWVEVWANVRAGNPTKIMIKATPPAGATWLIQNAHVIVESANKVGPANVAGQLIRFDGVHQYSVAGGGAAVTSWELFNEPGFSGALKVGLQPFQGCPSGSQARGVVLRESFEQTTFGS